MADKVLENKTEKADETCGLPRLWPMWALIALSLIGLVIAYPGLPDQVPIHFDFRFEPDGMAHKSALFWQGLLTPAYLAAMEYLPKKKRWREMREKQKKAFRIMEILTSSLFLLMTWLPVVSILDENFRIDRSLPMIFGFYLIILGNYMPTIRPNRFFGIRAPWIRNDERVWKKTHRAGGFLFVLFGILLILSGLTSKSAVYAVTGGVMIAGLIALYLYTLLLSRNGKTRQR